MEKIGKIVSIEYDKFKVKLFHATKTSTVTIDGSVYYFGNIGSYLKTSNSLGNSIICEVVAVLDQNTESTTISKYNLDSARELVIKPIGTLTKNREFNMGVGIFPSIYSDVFIVTKSDINTILSQYEEKKTNISDGDSGIVHKSIEIGLSKNMIDYQVKLNINRLFNIHTAILGNSGSGKSNTIAHILQSVYRKTSNSAFGAKTILFDVNGEYHIAFREKLEENISCTFYKPNNENNNVKYKPIFLPHYLMNLDEWLAFLLASDRTQKPFWDSVLQESYKFYKIFEKDGVYDSLDYENYFKWRIRNILSNVVAQGENDTVKMTIAQGIILKCRDIVHNIDENNNLLEFLDEANKYCGLDYGRNDGRLSSYLLKVTINESDAIRIDSDRLRPGDYFDYKFLKIASDIIILTVEAKGNSRIREYTSTMLTRLDYFLTHEDCAFMRDGDKFNGVDDYLNKVFGIDNESKFNQLTVIDSSEVGNDILELMTSVISRMIFTNRKRKIGDLRRANPIHLILDEAHRYIKKDAEYVLRENIFERIAREGRKFSLYLLISSQRPSELSSTVLSQCGNYIIHRIQNELDMKYIYSVLPYFSEDYTSKIKQAIPGEALIFGNCVPMPLQVMVTRANPDPDSKNCDISKEWFLQSNV